MFHKNKMGSIIRSTGTVFYSLLYLNSRQGFNGLKYEYSVISVIVDSLPGNTKNRESTRSWTARVRLFHPGAVGEECDFLGGWSQPAKKYFPRKREMENELRPQSDAIVWRCISVRLTTRPVFVRACATSCLSEQRVHTFYRYR